MSNLSTLETFPYIANPDKLPDMFAALVKAKVPHKFTYRFLESLGFASSNERGFISILKFLNLVDAKSVPTLNYIHLRDENRFSNVLGRLLKESYKQLFNENTDLILLNESELINIFNKYTGLDIKTVHACVNTFQVLVDLSDLAKSVAVSVLENASDYNEGSEASLFKPRINISLKLPTTTDPKVYEALFKHLKNLFN